MWRLSVSGASMPVTAQFSELAAFNYTVRIYLPYGTEWFGYFMRRLAKRPANLAFFARSLVTRA
jgi:proline dehydrogenase